MARPREFDEDDVLKQILFLFWEKGYEATSMRDIEQASGLGRMSLYNAFGDKEQVYLMALQKYIDATKRLYIKHLREGRLSELEALIDDYTRPHRLGHIGNWGCLMLNTITAAHGVNAKAQSMVEAFRAYAIGEIESVLQRAALAGEIAADIHMSEMAQFILITMWGAKVATRQAGSTAAAASVSRTLFAMLRLKQSTVTPVKH